MNATYHSTVAISAHGLVNEHPLSKLEDKRGRKVPRLDSENSPCYPSPPMSNPPSPDQVMPDRVTRPGMDHLTSAAIEPSSIVRNLATKGLTSNPLQADERQSRIDPSAVAFQSSPAQDMPVSGTQAPRSPPTASVGVSADRSGRKTKAHVASACVNCKRAHLSCDVQRPCSRCVASGKQESCFDVAHKKRGRPRLRDDSGPKVESLSGIQSASGSSSTMFADTGSGPARALVRARQRRAESFRSTQSDESYAWSTASPSFAGTTIPPYPTTNLPTPAIPRREVPTAFLDLDFVVIKANRPFELVMLAGQNARGRSLLEFVMSIDRKDFSTIRDRLRAEREARDPAYMPPIVQRGQDMIPSIEEADVDQVTRGFSDESYTWTQTRLGAAAQNFPARVRLAKAGVYFVIVTLPSFRPVEYLRPALPSPFSMGLRAPTSDPVGISTDRLDTFAHNHPPAQTPNPFRGSTNSRFPFPPFSPVDTTMTGMPRPTIEPPTIYRRPSAPEERVIHEPELRRASIQLPSLVAQIAHPPNQPPEQHRYDSTRYVAQGGTALSSDQEHRSPKRRRLDINDVLQ